MTKTFDIDEWAELIEALDSLEEGGTLFLRLNGRIVAEVIPIKEIADEDIEKGLDREE